MILIESNYTLSVLDAVEKGVLYKNITRVISENVCPFLKACEIMAAGKKETKDELGNYRVFKAARRHSLSNVVTSNGTR